VEQNINRDEALALLREELVSDERGERRGKREVVPAVEAGAERRGDQGAKHGVERGLRVRQRGEEPGKLGGGELGARICRGGLFKVIWGGRLHVAAGVEGGVLPNDT